MNINTHEQRSKEIQQQTDTLIPKQTEVNYSIGLPKKSQVYEEPVIIISDSESPKIIEKEKYDSEIQKGEERVMRGVDRVEE